MSVRKSKKKAKLDEQTEKLYVRFVKKQVNPNELGRRQAFYFLSCGARPKNPDEYFLRLMEGRKWFNVTQAMIKETWGTFEWWGWYQYWVDWKGERWVLKYLMSWYPKPPDWLFKEDSELNDEERRLLLDEIDDNEKCKIMKYIKRRNKN